MKRVIDPISNDKEYFLGYVRNDLRSKIQYLQDLWGIDLESLIYEKANELGHDHHYIESKFNVIVDRYIRPGGRMMLLNTPQCSAYIESLDAILNNLEKKYTINEKDILRIISDTFGYDYDYPKKYLTNIPDDIFLPVEQKNWLDFQLPKISKIDTDKEYIPLYSNMTTIYHEDYSNRLEESELYATCFIDNALLKSHNIEISKLDPWDIIFNHNSNIPLFTFKNLELIDYPDKFYEIILHVVNNDWRLHSNDMLVRITSNLIIDANLKWDDFLNMSNDNDEIIKFESWLGPYIKNDTIRDRINKGTRLKIKTQFLLNYMKNNNKSLISIQKNNRTVHEINSNRYVKTGSHGDKRIIITTN